ncbi:hypothetical protein RJ639_019028 [Escallonia herrerae]|uniref:Uncharacterized protein n=1 Tax=Escallonia herrerae TaxID=1293975 RepID=A0AA89AGL3_9ASTE|nr:hypothetical protein RJ639_019028 [Escallonia herrerae]
MFPARGYGESMPLIYNKTISSCNSTTLLSQVPFGVIICNDIGSYGKQMSSLSSTTAVAAILIADEIMESSRFTYPGKIEEAKSTLQDQAVQTLGL